MESKKEKRKVVFVSGNSRPVVMHFFRGMGAPVEFWSHRFSPKVYPGNDIQDAWSEVGGFLKEAVRDFDQKESA